jgi:two-component system cell cycle sensor histidine kinase/response regulator CckA
MLPWEELSVDDAAAPPGRGDDDWPPRLAGRCVLVVEDQAIIAMHIEQTIREAGAAILLAPDGRGALALAGRAERFDAAVLDLWLPDMDGAELAQRLRATHPGLPVLIESGAARDGAACVIAGGPTAVLLKPFDPDELVRAIARLVERPASGQRTKPPT